MEGLAEPGGILVSNTVHDHVRDRLPFAFFSGNPQDGLAALQISLRLNPQALGLPSRLNLMTCGLYLSGKYEAAVEVAKKVVRLNPDYPLVYRWLAAALGQLGQSTEAKEALERAIAIRGGNPANPGTACSARCSSRAQYGQSYRSSSS
jgi:tetratricopeptide (TPR) repeat protein